MMTALVTKFKVSATRKGRLLLFLVTGKILRYVSHKPESELVCQWWRLIDEKLNRWHKRICTLSQIGKTLLKSFMSTIEIVSSHHHIGIHSNINWKLIRSGRFTMYHHFKYIYYQKIVIEHSPFKSYQDYPVWCLGD